MNPTPVRPADVQFDVEYSAQSSRLLLFARWFLVIPQLVAVYLLSILLGIITFLAWWAILFTREYPRGMWDFALMIVRWQARVQVYTYLLRDDYPPFGDEPYPVMVEMVYPGPQSRLLLFIRWLLLIPHMVCLAFVGIAACVAFFLMWWAILFTGTAPRGLFDFIVGAIRWGLRVSVYADLLTDQYPPFSLD